MSPRNVIRLAEKAVAAQQLYAGATSLPIRVQQRLYSKLSKAVDRCARAAGLSVIEVFEQVAREASRRGAKTPQPGKDY